MVPLGTFGTKLWTCLRSHPRYLLLIATIAINKGIPNPAQPLALNQFVADEPRSSSALSSPRGGNSRAC